MLALRVPVRTRQLIGTRGAFEAYQRGEVQEAPMQFHDRRHAGIVLARALSRYANRSDVIVLALPRGGLPVAYEVADALQAPLDVLIVRKLGVPGHEELAMGAIASGGTIVKNGEVIESLRIPEDEVEAVAAAERTELGRRERAYRGDAPALDLTDKTVILIDDGLATGSSMKAAAEAISQMRPKRVVAAVPVGPPETCVELQAMVDEMICAVTPRPFFAVGAFYVDFTQTTDAEVRDLLAAARAHRSSNGAVVFGTGRSEIQVEIDAATSVAATLTVPTDPKGVVLFAHGSGSGRHSPRNRSVAAILQHAHFATVLADILTADEERVDDVTAHLRFDITFLGRRLARVMDWLDQQPALMHLPIGIFGASTGAAAALVAADERADKVRAVVSRGGRPDLAGDVLPRVTAPTLLIVGGWDQAVIDLNRAAYARLVAATAKELVIIPRSTHLFEEPGALEQVAQHARDWFKRFLPRVEAVQVPSPS
jgi:putative phosphoribosyl transferase